MHFREQSALLNITPAASVPAGAPVAKRASVRLHLSRVPISNILLRIGHGVSGRVWSWHWS